MNKSISYSTIHLFFACFLLVFFSACKKQKDLTQQEPLKERSATYLLKRYERNKLDYGWVGMKLDVELRSLGESQGFKANIRMRKDSCVWISISPALGIEVFRVLITPDSLKYISKIPDNKYYYTGRFEDINEVAKVGLDFDMLQDLLIGNAIGLEKDEGKFRSNIDGQLYQLTSRYKRKVRRMVGVDDRKLDPNDTIIVNPNDPKYQRSVRKADEDDIIVSRYWLDPNSFKLIKSVFNDLINQRTLEINYSGFKTEEEILYPSNCIIDIRNVGQQQQIEFEITRIALNKAYDIPFEIPDDFERKEKINEEKERQ